MKWDWGKQVCSMLKCNISLPVLVETLAIIVKYWQEYPEVKMTPVLIVSPTDLVAKQWDEALRKFTKQITSKLCTTSNVCLTKNINMQLTSFCRLSSQ